MSELVTSGGCVSEPGARSGDLACLTESGKGTPALD